MTTLGAEVGQKMRSAIKAKLLELNCYVDDELPDYVMVMVANKRSKSQMKEDLQLFLATKTATFVDWLHIVLKKLKEVTVTNPEVYKKTTKRKSEEPQIDIKKEPKLERKVKKVEPPDAREELVFKSLTDDLPINANHLAEQRKIIIMKENKSNNSAEVMQDTFDIPLLSEVNMSTEEELEDIEKKIKSVKSRLGLLVGSDEEDCTAKPPVSLENRKKKKSPEPEKSIPDPPKRARITFEDTDSPTKPKSVLERLGKRRSSENGQSRSKRSRIEEEDAKTKDRRSGKRHKESVLSRLGVMSKVSVPYKQPEEPIKNRDVPSVVKIKPRVIPHDAPQANKNLLLKAVAEAQRSIAQTPKVGNTLKPEALYTKKYKEKLTDEKMSKKENKTKKILVPDESTDDEYIPTPVKKTPPKYAPKSNSPENGKMKQQFIVTLDGIEKTKYKNLASEEGQKTSIKSRLDKKKSPSPIIFDKVTSPSKNKPNIPDKLPVIHAPPSVKNKERCKYWPSCRQGDKCEFVHPSTNCEKLPHCKFGDKCLFLHPSCKFGSSCTRRGCVYSHAANKAVASRIVSPVKQAPVQVCKFFPNCANASCPFYHPKPCRFGKFCKNQSECNFSHTFAVNKSSLTWRPK